MKNFVLLLFIAFCQNSCHNIKNEKRIVFFFDHENLFSVIEQAYDTMSIRFYGYDIPVYSIRYDSTRAIIGYKIYYLLHYRFFEKSDYRDTIYEKPKAFLDSIKYRDSGWLKSEKNLRDFWGTKPSAMNPDTLEIYMIEPKGSDSLVIRRVHRGYHPNREG